METSSAVNNYVPQRTKPTVQNLRNYYNVTNQRAPVEEVQFNKQSQQAQYENYYSVYDEDADLYRDIGK